MDCLNVILCAGGFNPALFPFGSFSSNSMIPVNGKPIIGWLLDDMIVRGIQDATIVARSDDAALQSFVRDYYQERPIDAKLSKVKNSSTILHSIQCGLADAPATQQLRILLGDTLIRDAFPDRCDYLYCSKVEDYSRWCHAKTEGEEILSFIDKPTTAPCENSVALAGYYHLADRNLFSQAVSEAISQGKSEISHALEIYMATRSIKAIAVKNWIDFGHLDGLVEARHTLKFPRHFNSILIDSLTGTLRKQSQDKNKFTNEIAWYKNIPPPLSIFAPRMVEWVGEGEHQSLTQEFFGYPTISELYLYGSIDPGTWHSIFQRLFKINSLFRKHSEGHARYDYSAVYVNKTQTRLEALKASNIDIFHKDHIIVNGVSMRGLPLIEKAILSKAASLSVSEDNSIIHGDYCFSNILIDLNNMIVRLIDPRGSFHNPGVYGDPKYDIAKLAHSIVGLYDFIVGDQFTVKSNGSGIFFRIGSPKSHNEICELFWKLCEKHGYSKTTIQFIEALLFLTMIPLHSDFPNRQIAMYLTSLSKFNNILPCD